MSGIACPHCTFINPPTKVKCSVCLRLLRKRDRSVDDATATRGQRGTTSSTPAEDESATHSSESTSQPADAPRRADATDVSAAPPATSARLSASAGDAAAPPLVPTLFSTASGRPVSVRRESILKAAEQLGDVLAPTTETRAPTLLDTASRTAVATVRGSALVAATAAEAASVPTLFSTASGAAVRVSAAALQRAAERLQDCAPSDGDGGESETAVVLRAAEAVPAVPPAKQTAGTAERGVRVAGVLGAGRRQRGFVPPQQRVAPPPPPLPTALPASASVAAAATLSATQRVLQRTGLALLRLNPDACVCRSITPPPPLSSITAQTFSFAADDCGSVLAALLGVRGAEPVQASHWHAALLRLGASPSHCTPAWSRHALLSAMARARAMATATTSATPGAFSAVVVLLCAMQLYNTEMVDGERPALRKVVEGDIPSASLMVLYLSSVRDERGAPHTRIVTLSDGIYHLKATCDVPLSNLLREGVLVPGQRMAVCGSKLLLHGQCSPTECEEQVVLGVNYNCVRAVAPLTPLGVCRGEPVPLALSLVHPLGGLVPAIHGVVARVLPPFFVSQADEGAPATGDGARQLRDRGPRVVRNAHAQLQLSDRLLRAVEGEPADSAEPRPPLSRVTSLLIATDGAEALVQQWETVDEHALLADDDGSVSLPVEGSSVTLYAVNPAKSRTAAAPFARAKLFFSSRKLHYVPSKKPLLHQRRVWQSAADHGATTGLGDVADVCGLYLGSHRSPQGLFALLLLRDDTYALLQLPPPTAGRVLSLSMPATERVPTAVLNTTFLSGEDSLAGSDCCRLFANEYTVLLQRSTQSNIKDALTAAAAELRARVEAAPQKYASRRAEVFRCLDEGESGGAAAASAAAAAASRSVVSALEAPSDLGNGAPAAFTAAAAASATAGRLPYYLREGRSGDAAGRRQGVVLPAAAHVSPRASFAPPPPSATAAAPRCRHYGNAVDVVFLLDPRLNRRAWHPLTDALPGAAGASTQPGDVFQRVQLCWRLSADSADDVTCRLEARHLLGTVLERACPLTELCTIVADERHLDVSLVRGECLLRWRRLDAPLLWWRFFADSRVLGTAAELDGASERFLWWLPGEWAAAMKLVSSKLQTALFFFTTAGEALRHVRLISDSCNVAELPCD
ncbi:DNA repair protein BRCA2 [Novymonas esmeraldas]|uniref:DNA repair protein BRCA2 n=1 Tax=Novymonas esmeraldas TaxID=1808958 RepID=A0AAW0F1F0_9TRYP